MTAPPAAPPSRPRSLRLLRGSPASTARQARESLGNVAPGEILWVGEDAPSGVVACLPRATSKVLGRSFAAVVLDAHEALDADVLGRIEGLILRGGALLLRIGTDEDEAAPRAGRPELASWPFTASDVGRRFRHRFLRMAGGDLTPPAPSPWRAEGEEQGRGASGGSGGTEQASVVASLVERFLSGEPSLLALVADRGRGKSSALGLALASAWARRPDLRVAVCSAEPEGAREVLRFAARDTLKACSPMEILAALEGSEHVDVLVIDEAAQLPVPLLQRLTRLAPRATLAFSTTCRGYEGTGRGFVLRFLAWARTEGRPFFPCTLQTPIRFDAGDPLESFVASALLLDTDLPLSPSARSPSALSPSALSSPLYLQGEGGRGGEVSPSPRQLSRDELASDERLLRQVFGLLVHAHYRTKPGDLERLLDAPNLAVHALIEEGSVLAVSLVAREGGLDAAQCERLARGAGRIQGHALPDTLINHGGSPRAGELTYARSVRIAVHPAHRRRGLASKLVEHVHESYQVDAFGTLFGATPEVVRFRQALGYELVRLGASRGARTGEPSAVMLRPVTPRAKEIVGALQVELARNLPWQLRAFGAEGLPLDEELEVTLRKGLPTPAPMTSGERDALVDAYTESARPADAVAHALTSLVREREGVLSRLDARQGSLLRARWIEELPWREAARRARYKDAGEAMRAMRGAVRAVRQAVE